MKHKCHYCDATSTQNREALIDMGWSFADIRSPIRRYFKACSQLACQNKFLEDINAVFKG